MPYDLHIEIANGLLIFALVLFFSTTTILIRKEKSRPLLIPLFWLPVGILADLYHYYIIFYVDYSQSGMTDFLIEVPNQLRILNYIIVFSILLSSIGYLWHAYQKK